MRTARVHVWEVHTHTGKPGRGIINHYIDSANQSCILKSIAGKPGGDCQSPSQDTIVESGADLTSAPPTPNGEYLCVEYYDSKIDNALAPKC